MPATDRPAVLLIDDSEATCTLVTALLHKDFAVETAADGAAAIETLRVKRYAAILLDLRMPHPDGFEILQHLQENQPELLRRVIVVTALAQPDMARVREFGVCAVIQKPFEIDVLLQTVKECAGSDGPPLKGLLSNGMILLLADIIRYRL